MDVRPGRKRKVTQFEICRSGLVSPVTGVVVRVQWYFHLRSSNGKISLQSEMYPTKNHARRAIIRLINVISAEPPIVVL